MTKRKKKVKQVVLSIPENTLKDLKCKKCKCYLSAPGVLLNVNGNFCSKCAEQSQSYMPNTIYEKLAKHFLFPCKYDGCKTVLPFDHVQNHEVNCKQRIYKCPITEQECWSGKLEALKQHLNEKHKDRVFSCKIIQLDCADSNCYTRILVLDGEYFLVNTKFEFNQKILTFAVKFVGLSTCGGVFRYYVQIFGDTVAKPYVSEHRNVLANHEFPLSAKHETNVKLDDLVGVLKNPKEFRALIIVMVN